MSMRYQAAILTASYSPLKTPNAPTIGTATAGNAQVSITFTAPADVGGGAITGYIAVAKDSSSGAVFTNTGSSSPIVVTGLTNGNTYTVTVAATNAFGTGPASAASNSVTPVPVVSSVEYLVVAGGGSGGQYIAGGGGAGGLRSGTASITAGTAYTITIGAGGSQKTSRGAGNNGNVSSAFGINTTGGGGGGNIDTAGSNGGSGGGGGTNTGGSLTNPGTGNAGGYSPVEGYAGGVAQGSAGDGLCGGGGGAGGVGLAATSSPLKGGDGGPGVQWPSGSGTYYGGGGGGAGGDSINVPGDGGVGGGGTGSSNTTPTAGTANTGGGGGGGRGSSGTPVGAAGGSGVVILRYSNVYPDATSTTGSPTFTNTGGYKTYKFTSSGSITF